MATECEHVWVRDTFTYCMNCNLVSWWLIPPSSMVIHESEEAAREWLEKDSG